MAEITQDDIENACDDLKCEMENVLNIAKLKNADFGISKETLEMAEMVANMPPLSDDKKSIEEWAKRLAADISKGRDE